MSMTIHKIIRMNVRTARVFPSETEHTFLKAALGYTPTYRRALTFKSFGIHYC